MTKRSFVRGGGSSKKPPPHPEKSQAFKRVVVVVVVATSYTPTSIVENPKIDNDDITGWMDG